MSIWTMVRSQDVEALLTVSVSILWRVEICNAKRRRHNGHPAIGHESYRRSEVVVANTPEPRKSQ